MAFYRCVPTPIREALPNGYQRIKYLRANRKQYLTLHIEPVSGDDVFVTASSNGAYDYNTIVGVRQVQSFEVYFFSSNDVRIWHWAYARISLNSVSGESGLEKIRKINFKVIDTLENKYQLGAYNNGYLLTGDIYDFEVSARCKMVPALDTNGKPCMYDTIAKQPIYNAGDGEFGYELMDGTYVAPI